MPEHMPNTFRLTGISNVKQLLAVLWGIANAGNVERRHGENVAIPGLVKKRHVVCLICKNLWERFYHRQLVLQILRKCSLCTYLSTIRKRRRPRFIHVISRIRFEDVE